jgi:hypothetical protein
MGVATHNVPARLAASLGAMSDVAPHFEGALDVPCGGVLCALPALLATGLLDSAETYFKLRPGYYALDSLLMLLAFMALCRVQSMEALRYEAPGEWGRLLGLDRIPEVKTLREKVHELSHKGKAKEWSAALCQRWMLAAPEQAAVLYIDGHVRVYHGEQTKLPKHYVAREKLCQRASVDYWINAMDGQPFMVVNQVVDPGMIQVIEGDILPKLESMVSEWVPTSRTYHFMLVFDREGYSPEFFKRMKKKRVACLTYHKYPEKKWELEEFKNQSVPLVSGQVVSMMLAERGTCLSNGLWVRELRKLTVTGHQTSIVTTDYETSFITLAAWMFARWSQENFFRYARQHYGLDRLADYQTEEITDPIKVVNPLYRELCSKVKSANGKRSRLLAKFGALNIEHTIEKEHMEAFIAQKAWLSEQIEALETQIQELKAQRKETPRHIKVQDLPEAERFKKLSHMSKHFLDTLKMVAYRAESAMANSLRQHMKKQDEVRVVLQALYTAEADLLPDYANKILKVRLHHSPRVHTDTILRELCEELNATETVFPRSELRLIFELGSA